MWLTCPAEITAPEIEIKELFDHNLNRSFVGAMAIFIVMALSWHCVTARADANNSHNVFHYADSEVFADSLTVSVVTCYPGPEIYELCGHSAVRVKGEGRDSVWNFGMFNFREPNFVYRFVKGETDYMCVGYPFAWFLPEYQKRGSKVVEQELNLTQPEARKLLALLQTEALPQNCRYRYNYVKDNCATRILDRIDDAVSSRVAYPDSVAYATFRNEMRAYHRDYPWYQFGIDLALGSGIDYSLNSREEMFVPVEMMKKMETARLADGRSLVKRQNVLNEGVACATLPPTPWWQSPLFVSIVALLLAVTLCAVDYRRRRITRWAYSLWFFLLGLAGSLVAFLVFVSVHEATSPNTLILWLNPLQLIMAVCVWSRALRPAAVAMAWYNIVATLCMLVFWPFQSQSGNPAFFPLMAATLLLSSTYAIIAHKESYNINRGSSSSGRPARVRAKNSEKSRRAISNNKKGAK